MSSPHWVACKMPLRHLESTKRLMEAINARDFERASRLMKKRFPWALPLDELHVAKQEANGKLGSVQPFWQLVFEVNHPVLTQAFINSPRRNPAPLMGLALKVEDWARVKALLDAGVDPNGPGKSSYVLKAPVLFASDAFARMAAHEQGIRYFVEHPRFDPWKVCNIAGPGKPNKENFLPAACLDAGNPWLAGQVLMQAKTRNLPLSPKDEEPIWISAGHMMADSFIRTRDVLGGVYEERGWDTFIQTLQDMGGKGPSLEHMQGLLRAMEVLAQTPAKAGKRLLEQSNAFPVLLDLVQRWPNPALEHALITLGRKQGIELRELFALESNLAGHTLQDATPQAPRATSSRRM